MNKAMKKDISIAALIAIAFMVSIYVLGSLEYGDAIMMAPAAGFLGLILFYVAFNYSIIYSIVLH